MAKIIRREWTSTGPLGRRVRHTAYGYTLMVDGKRERKMSSDWQTEQPAYEALHRRLQEIQSPSSQPEDQTIGELAEKYLAYKANTGKRSLQDDKRVIHNRLLPAFGTTQMIRTLTEAQISQYERRRISEVSAYTVCNELSILRHMLRLARRWGYIDRVPMIELPQKPPHRERYLTEDEIKRLLASCAQSRNPYLSCIVTVALNTGMRKGRNPRLGVGTD
jgi:integrase